MQKTLLVTILFALIMISSNCELTGDCIKVDIPKNEKSWFLEYKKPRKIILKSNLGRIDSLELLDLTSNFSTCNKFETGEFQYEQCVIEIFSNLMKEKIFFSYYSSKSSYQKGYIEFDNAIIDFYKNDINQRASKRYCKYKNDSLIGHILKSSNVDSTEITTAFWSKELGIIEYQTGAGEKFEVVDIR